MRLFIGFVLLLLHSIGLFAQTSSNIPMGTWRTHLPTTSVTTIAHFANKVYCGSSQSSFIYDLSENSLSPLSKIDGLTANNVAVIRFNEAGNYGIIGYEDGNVDIIRNGKLSNFNDIIRSNIVGSKTINNITLYKDLAFLSCDFGVTIINISKNEIVESWINLSTGGLQNKVYGCVLNQAKDSIFLATENGMLSAQYDKPGINLIDFSKWHSYTNISTTKTRAVGQLGEHIYAGVSGDGVYVLRGSNWINIGIVLPTTATCWNLTNSTNKLLLSADTKIYSITSPTIYTSPNTSPIKEIHDAVYDSYGNLWIADSFNGLHKLSATGLMQYNLNGPFNTACFNLYYYKNTMLANSGGYDNTYQNRYFGHGFYEFQNQENWFNYNGGFINYPSEIRDNIIASYNPFDDTLYIGTFGYGLVSFKKPNTFIKYTTANSPLRTNTITGLDTDTDGTLWIANYGVGAFQPSIFSKTKSGKWKSYTLSNRSENKYILQLKIDSVGNKWMRYGNNGMDKGLIVYNEKTFQERYFSTASNNGNLPSNQINCIDVDKKGIVWIGSSQGLSAFYDPSNAFTGSFTAPIYEGFGVLFDKNVTCIKTDGGNRKWVGTTEGLWLFEDDFNKFLAHFTVDNSPLYSNNIIDVDIHEITGEVFIATDKGILSYRADASMNNADFNEAKIFPNPVRPDFAGVITIQGLQDNVRVKITDMQGKLYYESKTNGGTATWNMNNYAGVKVESGMYLVFATTSDGKEKYVGKIAIVQ